MDRPVEKSRNSTLFLRLALGFVYFHFGVLKFYPDLSPAESLATQTIMAMTYNIFDATTSQFLLAILETFIGLGLIFNVLPRITFGLFLFHMAGTFMPLFLLPEFVFKIAPLAPNIEGQYIFKNLVYVAAGWTVLKPSAFPARAKAMTKSKSLILSIPASQEVAPHEAVLA